MAKHRKRMKRRRATVNLGFSSSQHCSVGDHALSAAANDIAIAKRSPGCERKLAYINSATQAYGEAIGHYDACTARRDIEPVKEKIADAVEGFRLTCLRVGK